MTDFELMGLALEEARKAAALGEGPVGAVVARRGEVVAAAHNTRETEKNALHHAELLAIDAACKKLGGWRLWECELFVTLEPCPMCAGAILNSRVRRVVYGAADAKAGCCGSLLAAGAIGCIPLSLDMTSLTVPLALPFWLEGGMVALQILFYRRRGRPLFAAAPLHRWLEKRGLSAVNVFYSLCALSVCGLALASRLARWA